jgi:hypothetical protein
MQNDSKHPLTQALRDSQNATSPPAVNSLDTTKIKIPLSGVEKIVNEDGSVENRRISGLGLDEDMDFVATKTPEWAGQKDSYPRVVQKEKPAHRIIAYMSASGATPQRIADETGYGVQQVRILLNQDWMKAHIALLIHENFNDDISGLLKAGAVDALMTIRNLSTESLNEKVRLSAAQDLLDRYRGKPTQFVHTSSSEVPQDPSDEIARLENDLKEIQLLQ